jgi:hypothetical protein
VAKVPEKLYFNPEDPKSSDYETEMELEVNNIVWFSILESANALEILVEDKLYKVMPYSDIYCVKRGDEVIVLNGLCLCQTVTHKKISELDFISESRIDMSKCVVKFIGKPNKRYKNENYVDHQDLKVDDLVLLQPRTPIQFLERKVWMAKFNGDELYIIVPRRKIVAVLNRQE